MEQSFKAIRRDYDVYATKAALDHSLEALLSAESKECILFHLKVRYKISIYDDEPVTIEELKYIMQQLFHEGGSMFISKFNEKYFELTGNNVVA